MRSLTRWLIVCHRSFHGNLSLNSRVHSVASIMMLCTSTDFMLPNVMFYCTVCSDPVECVTRTCDDSNPYSQDMNTHN